MHVSAYILNLFFISIKIDFNRFLEFEKDSIVKLISWKFLLFYPGIYSWNRMKESYFPGNHDNHVDRSENVAQLKLFDGNL